MSRSDVYQSWRTARLGELVDILDSQRVPVNARERAQRRGQIPYYGATGQVGWIDDYLFDEELVLLGEDGAPFLAGDKPKAYLIRGKSWVNNHAHVLRALGGIPNAFLMHQLNQIEYGPFVSGTTRLKLPQAPMRRMQLLIPPLPEQHRIVETIESHFARLDSAVATLERITAKLKRYRASVLKAAVEGHLVQTEAELALREGRDYEPASVLVERVLKERRRRWEEAELAKLKAAGKTPKDDGWKAKYEEPLAPDSFGLQKLPEGWCWANIDQLSSDIRYGTSSKTTDDSHGVPVLRMGNIVDGTLDFDDLKYLPLGYHEFPELLLSPGDLLFNRTNSAELVGKTAVFRSNRMVCSFASYLIRVRTLPGCVPEYVCYFINSFAGRRWIASVVSQQVGQANVNGTKLKACVIPLPPLVEQQRIVTEVERLLSLSDDVRTKTRQGVFRCQRLRQAVLKWAFEGKLVDQDRTDEPASVLLERIKAEREKAEGVNQKKLREGRQREMA